MWYDAEYKTPSGTVASFLKHIGATKDQMRIAYELARKSDQYRRLIELAPNVTNVRHQQNGSFAFEKPYDPKARQAEWYTVHANGVIRSLSTKGWRKWCTRLTAPKPRLVLNDPVQSILKTYLQTFEELIVKAERRHQRIHG